MNTLSRMVEAPCIEGPAVGGGQDEALEREGYRYLKG
jgi:hypothetical protein